MTRLVIAGGGGFGCEVLQYLTDLALPGATIAVLDDNAANGGRHGPAAPYLGAIEEWTAADGDRVVICVGDPAVRLRMRDRLSQRGAKFFTLVHPKAYVAGNAVIGSGCIVAPFAFVGPGARIADQVVLNTYASVGHDAVVNACAVLSPYAVLNGHCVLDQLAFLGTHATVTAGLTVGRNSKVAAGSVVYRDVAENSLALGNPARARAMYAPGPSAET